MAVYFISGIDTDAGKSVVTGVLARLLHREGIRVITQKFIQTGCRGISEDLVTHRRIMEMPLQEADETGLTCPYLLSYPASPHLAAEIDGVEIRPEKIREATAQLEKQYDLVLLEGAGGLYVPVTRRYLTIDYIRENDYPLILVASSKLGSINHTLMSLELCRLNNIRLTHLVYNEFPGGSEEIIGDTFRMIGDYLEQYFPDCQLLELPVIAGNNYPDWDLKLRY